MCQNSFSPETDRDAPAPLVPVGHRDLLQPSVPRHLPCCRNNQIMSSAAKRFRFDSFASEFGCREDQEDVPDNDSGIGKSNLNLAVLLPIGCKLS